MRNLKITKNFDLFHLRCGCCLRHRRKLGIILLAGVIKPIWAREGVDVGKSSGFTRLVPAEDVERAATQQYQQLLQSASKQNVLGTPNHPQVQRLNAIAQRIIPFAGDWNQRAKQWRWEVNLIGSKQLNAFCMPGGKIAFFSGILEQLKLSDDEVAMIMGHEMAHALREHARERMGKSAATNLGTGLLSSLFGLGNIGQTALNLGAQLVSLRWSRSDESEADLVGLDLAARAGYDPSAGVTLWRKMLDAGGKNTPQWLSTHPAGQTRIQDIETTLPKVMPLFKNAPKPTKRWDS